MVINFYDEQPHLYNLYFPLLTGNVTAHEQQETSSSLIRLCCPSSLPGTLNQNDQTPTSTSRLDGEIETRGFRYNFIRKVIYLYIIIIIYIRQREEKGKNQEPRTIPGHLPATTGPRQSVRPSSILILDYNRHATKHLGSKLSSTKLGRRWGYFPRGGETEDKTKHNPLFLRRRAQRKHRRKGATPKANASIQGPQTPAPDFADGARTTKSCLKFV